MEEVREKIVKLLRKTRRKGMPSLINAMDKGGFFTAPCSTEHHLCHEGGLAEHSLNVYETMCKTHKALYGELLVAQHHSIIIASILHDLGKMGDYGKEGYVPNVLKSGEISKAKPWMKNTELLHFDHEVLSFGIARQHIYLTEEEAFAILYHNGLYTNTGREVKGHERPLQMLLHFSDMWCSRVVEKEKEE